MLNCGILLFFFIKNSIKCVKNDSHVITHIFEIHHHRLQLINKTPSAKDFQSNFLIERAIMVRFFSPSEPTPQ